MTVSITFWGSIDNVPNTTHSNLKPDTIKRKMTEALEAQDDDGDIWANKQTIDSTQWVEEQFCLVKENGVIRDESHLLEDMS